MKAGNNKGSLENTERAERQRHAQGGFGCEERRSSVPHSKKRKASTAHFGQVQGISDQQSILPTEHYRMKMYVCRAKNAKAEGWEIPEFLSLYCAVRNLLLPDAGGSLVATTVVVERTID